MVTDIYKLKKIFLENECIKYNTYKKQEISKLLNYSIDKDEIVYFYENSLISIDLSNLKIFYFAIYNCLGRNLFYSKLENTKITKKENNILIVSNNYINYKKIFILYNYKKDKNYDKYYMESIL